jgi:hypothetical protein
MTNFPNPEFPISSADCAEIEAIFIELMRARDQEVQGQASPSMMPPVNLPGTAQDLRS